MQTKIQKAFENTIYDSIIRSVPDMPDHDFSDDFERKMHLLIQKENKSITTPRRISGKKLYVCIIAAIVAVCTAAFSVSAVRDFFKSFIMDIFSTHTEVQSADFGKAPSAIETVYGIRVPDGFELRYEDELFEWSPVISHEYYKENEYIFFTQYAKPSYSVNVNTENHIMNYISVNGYDGYIIDMGNNEYYISWDSGDYIFELIGNIGEESLIEVVETVDEK